jgi:predicted amidophosphoribosyltransferase
MSDRKSSSLNVACPCCGARLTVDPELQKVVAHEAPPPNRQNAPNLDHAGTLLREQAARREAIFRQSTEDEKSKSQLLERKFEEALKKSKDQPVERPIRDFDLD